MFRSLIRSWFLFHVQQFAKRAGISAEANSAQTTSRGSLAAASVLMPVNAVKEKTPEVRKQLFDAVKGNLLFEGLTDGLIETSADSNLLVRP